MSTSINNSEVSNSRDNSTPQIQDVGLLHENSMLQVSWSDGGRDIYPYVWLRDNCQCPSCFLAVSGSRVTPLRILLLEEKPVHAQVSACGSHIDLEWQDGHKSMFLSNWLFDRAFNNQRRTQRYEKTLRLPPVYWGSELLDDIPTSSFEEVIANDKALLKWLTQLEVYGLTLMRDVGTEGGQVNILSRRLEDIRRTHYGTVFSVRAKPQPNNAAYNSGPLPLHLDLPFYYHTPGIQVLHCLKQASSGMGGESEFVDGVHVANKMREESPQLFEVLKNTAVDWWDVGTDEYGKFNKISQQPTFRFNHRGDIIGIQFNQAVRDSFMDASPQEVQLWYHAYKLYANMLYDPDNYISWKLTPGTCVVFDNTRVFHGRRGFQGFEGERELDGIYLDWDEARSKRRVLNNKFNGVHHESTSGEQQY
ncbi:unnamed protein product, partial [Meganyctiphanes norvegica]